MDEFHNEIRNELQEEFHLAARTYAIEPFRVMEVLRRARELELAGRSIVHMEIGQPDFAAPEPVLNAAAAAMREHALGYTPALGMPELRSEIARYYARTHGIDVPAARVAITTGSSAGLLLALGALSGPGDDVLLPDPCYPCSRNLVRFTGARPVDIPVDESTSFHPDAGQVLAAWGHATRGVIVATPANPSGTSISPEGLKSIGDVCDKLGGFLIVDEIYGNLVYEREASTALLQNPDAIVVSGFSKYFCMTGWRLGWMIAPESLLCEVEKLAQNIYVSPPVLAQHACLAAFCDDSLTELDRRRSEFRRRRDLLCDELQSLGFRIPVVPDGAFYIYADCSAFSASSSDLAVDLLENAGVATAPGRDFGRHRAEKYLRFAYTRDESEIREGVRRLREYLGRNLGSNRGHGNLRG